MVRGRVILVVLLGVLAVAVPTASADTFAALEVRPPPTFGHAGAPPRSDTDIEVINAATGAQVPLPAGVNTTADELHPTISGDGNRLAFERYDPLTGSVRIIVVDMTTGQSSDLYNAFDVGEDSPVDPAITPSGETVATGGPFHQVSPSRFSPELQLTPLAPFPDGPYAHIDAGPGGMFTIRGELSDVGAGTNTFAYQFNLAGGSAIGVLNTFALTQQPVLVSGSANYDHPALAASNPHVVLFDIETRTGNNQFAPGDIGYRPIDTIAGTPITLTGVNTPADEFAPAVTPDERYVAFIRQGSDGHDRLFLYDTETQLMFNSTGVDIGPAVSPAEDDVSLYVKPSFGVIRVMLGNISAELNQATSIGILVQRIIGRHTVLGRKEFRLRKVGRVPLGHFRKGKHHIHWKLLIDGRRLRPGRYLLTLRALTRAGVVHELAKPTVVRIRRHRT